MMHTDPDPRDLSAVLAAIRTSLAEMRAVGVTRVSVVEDPASRSFLFLLRRPSGEGTYSELFEVSFWGIQASKGRLPIAFWDALRTVEGRARLASAIEAEEDLGALEARLGLGPWIERISRRVSPDSLSRWFSSLTRRLSSVLPSRG